MFGIAAVIAFVIALLLDLAGVSKGHFNEETAVIVGFLCLAVHLVWPAWHGWAGRPASRNPPA
jgi:hypothetical protein